MDILINETQARRLQWELCVRYGFCDLGERYDALIQSMPRNLAEVVDEIFRAEGLDPEIVDRRLWRTIRDCVVSAHHASFDSDD